MNRPDQRTARYLLSLIGQVNPYNRELLNSHSEYYIYQMGFLAGYLASLCERDPWVLKEFERHIERSRLTH